MRIGVSAGGTIDRMIEQTKQAEADGFTSIWFAGTIGLDPLTVIALCGRESERIELGTSIVQSYPRHPVAMAQQAATIRAVVGPGRFTLGLGVSHEPNITQSLGLSYDAPAAHMREYLAIVGALLSKGQANHDGERYRVRYQLPAGADAEPVPLLVAALAPHMLRAAGALADGTITWMANRRAIETHVAPRIRRAAERAGRAAPRVVVGLPVAVCDDPTEGRAAAQQTFARYGMLPNYRRILDIGGAEGAGDAAIVGDEETVAAEFRALIDAGATDIWAATFPLGDDREARAASRRRTQALLIDLARAS
jgi:F420-dependent oxidoreductase-like protein